MTFIKSLDSIDRYQDWLDLSNNNDRSLRSPIYSNYLPSNKSNNKIAVTKFNSINRHHPVTRINQNDDSNFKSIHSQYYFTYDCQLKTVILNIMVNNSQSLSIPYSKLYIDNKGNIKASNIGTTLRVLSEKFLFDVELCTNRSYVFIEDVTSIISKLDLMSKRQLKRYRIARSKKR